MTDMRGETVCRKRYSRTSPGYRVCMGLPVITLLELHLRAEPAGQSWAKAAHGGLHSGDTLGSTSCAGTSNSCVGGRPTTCCSFTSLAFHLYDYVYIYIYIIYIYIFIIYTSISMIHL